MNRIPIFLFVAARAWAQLVVHDPLNTAVNSAVQAGQAANHLEILRQWASQLENLNRQLRQLEDQLAVQQHISSVIGEPSAAGVGVVLRNLGPAELARTYGETLAASQRLANAIASLERTSEGIYRKLESRTALGRDFARQDALYLRYAAVDRHADNLAAVHAQADDRTAGLQADVALTLEQLRAAPTQAEVEKLSAKLNALNGQLAHLDAVRQSEAEKLSAQQILNINQAAKEQQDLLERQVAEERQSLSVVGAWQESIKVTPTSYARP